MAHWIKIFLLVGIIAGSKSYAQVVSTSILKKISSSDKFLFYLHGAVVSVLGDNAINQGAPEWGPYEYSKILDSLRKRGFNVISEIRTNGVDDSVYVNKIGSQLDTLLKAGVKKSNIILVGASSGSNVVIHVAARMNDPVMKYVIMGGCWPDLYKEYMSLKLTGNFLSIIEKSDPHKTCGRLFENRSEVTSSKEVELNTGLSHGFFYKGRKVWIDPIVEWFNATH